ncbi:MAG: glycosyltransferase family 2 protein [Lentisphaeria bacterium]|nr:glycosyltransferase family 2 protein [Lentisphaeria bacterium]
MRLAVVIPLANEERTAPELLSRVTDQLGPDDAVFCVVDNASKDDTRGAVERFAAESAGRSNIQHSTSNAQHSELPPSASAPYAPCSELEAGGEFRLKPVHQQATTHDSRLTTHDSPAACTVPVRCVWAPENRCVVDAYFRGYREAYDAGAEWILEMDGGLSHLPEEIPRFIQAMESGVDFAGGSRFVSGSAYRESRFARWLTSRGGTWVSNVLLGTKMKDMTSGFECFSRAAMKLVLSHGVRSKAHFFQTEIRYLMHRLNWVEVPITYSRPSKSVGKNSLKDAVKCLWALWRDKRKRR